MKVPPILDPISEHGDGRLPEGEGDGDADAHDGLGGVPGQLHRQDEGGYVGALATCLPKFLFLQTACLSRCHPQPILLACI